MWPWRRLKVSLRKFLITRVMLRAKSSKIIKFKAHLLFSFNVLPHQRTVNPPRNLATLSSLTIYFSLSFFQYPNSIPKRSISISSSLISFKTHNPRFGTLKLPSEVSGCVPKVILFHFLMTICDHTRP